MESPIVKAIERLKVVFSDVPGRQLSLAEASRLSGLELSRCEAVLDALVATGFLARGLDGVLSTSGVVQLSFVRAPVKGMLQGQDGGWMFEAVLRHKRAIQRALCVRGVPDTVIQRGRQRQPSRFSAAWTRWRAAATGCAGCARCEVAAWELEQLFGGAG